MGRWLWMGGIGLQRFLGDRGGLEFGCAGAQFDCFVRAQIGMAGSGDMWNSALLDLCHRRRHQSCAGKHDDKLAVPQKERDWWQRLWEKLLSPFPNCNAVENRPALP